MGGCDPPLQDAAGGLAWPAGVHPCVETPGSGAGEDEADGEGAAGFDADDDGPGAGDLPPPGATVTAGQQPAA